MVAQILACYTRPSASFVAQIDGEPAWKLEIGVQNKLRKVVLISSLRGLQSDLPAPFQSKLMKMLICDLK